jgi:hypothetical protein
MTEERFDRKMGIYAGIITIENMGGMHVSLVVREHLVGAGKELTKLKMCARTANYSVQCICTCITSYWKWWLGI